MQLTTYQKGGVIASAVWLSVVAVYAFSSRHFSDEIALRYGVLPLVIGWVVYFLLNVQTSPTRIAVGETDGSTASGTKDTAQIEPTTATAGWRYAARSLDLGVWSFAVWGLLEFVVRRTSFAFDDFLLYHPWIVVLLFVVVSLPLALACDAACYLMFRNTPGKALAGLSVVDRNGMLVDPRAYATRTLRLWVAGFACNIPLLNLAALTISARDLSKKGYTRYDATWGDKVMQRSLSRGRKFAFSAIFFVLIGAVQVGFLKPFAGQVGEAAGITLVLDKFGGEGWINPVTKNIAPMKGWSLKYHESADSWVVDKTDGSRVWIFHVAYVYNASLPAIAARLRTEAGGLWKYTGTGNEFFSKTGGVAWEGRRKLADDEIPGWPGPAFLLTRIENTPSGLWYVLYWTPTSASGFEEGHAVADTIIASTKS